MSLNSGTVTSGVLQKSLQHLKAGVNTSPEITTSAFVVFCVSFTFDSDAGDLAGWIKSLKCQTGKRSRYKLSDVISDMARSPLQVDVSMHVSSFHRFVADSFELQFTRMQP